MTESPNCPICQCDYTYFDSVQFICPECNHEWTGEDIRVSDEPVFKDAHGNALKDGDTVTVIKNLKLKGSQHIVKSGTKVKNIRLVDGDHNINCKLEGVGAIHLKSEFVKIDSKA